MFTAGLVFTPGGDDRINSLQDEDTLTGTGTNATLNAVLGNANDNGGTTISPVLNNISTINVQFTGSAPGPQGLPVATLDLQDAVGLTTLNVTRINQALGTQQITFANINTSGTNTFGISGVSTPAFIDYDFQEGALSATGAASTEAATFNINNVTLRQLRVGDNLANAAGTAEGFETVTINSQGATNQIDFFNSSQTRVLNLVGSANLGLSNSGANVLVAGNNAGLGQAFTVSEGEYNQYQGVAFTNSGGPLAAINGTTATGRLTVDISGFETGRPDPTNSGTTVFTTVNGGTANDTIISNGGIADTNLVINGNGGVDTLVLHNSLLDPTVNAVNPTITSMENLEVRLQGNANVIVDVSEIGGLERIFLRNETAAPAAGIFDLRELTAAQAGALSINHGVSRTTGINSNVTGDSTQVLVNLDNASGTADTVAISLVTDLNNTTRFNFALNADGNAAAATLASAGRAQGTAGVENITINDTDNESNAIELVQVAEHTGTLTVTGGAAGQFMNLDATANAYRWDQSGASLDGGTGSGAVTAINGRPTNGSRSDIGAGAAERIVAANFISTAYAGDVVIRVSDNAAAASLGGQNIQFGTGNDTVIFDQIGAGAANRFTAGLTISDTVNGGAGTDILGIDGNGVAVTITASEWTNVSNFEILRLIGNGVGGSNARNAVNSYNLTLTNDLLATNGAVNGNGRQLIIVNDNDATNDAGQANPANSTNDNTVAANGATNNGNGIGGNIAAATGVERGVTIDARTLTANNSFEYRGEEGALNGGGNTSTADRFILADANINGVAIIDGGATSNVTQNTSVIGGVITAAAAATRDVDSMRNTDVIEVRNSATVSEGDLANISNVGTLEFTNDTTVAQNSILVLNDAIVDRLVDAYQAARVEANVGTAAQVLQNQERLVVKAINNPNVAAATTGISIQAGSLTGQSALDVFLDRDTAATPVNITTGGGNDRVVILGNFAAGAYGVDALTGENINAYANGVVGARAVTGTINLGGQTGIGGVTNPLVDVIATFGATNLFGLGMTGVEFVDPNSALVIGASQLAALTGVRFTGAFGHQLIIIDDVPGGNNIDLSKIILNGGSLNFNVVDTNFALVNAGAGTFTFTNAVIDNSAAGNAIYDVTLTNPAALTGTGPVVVIQEVNAGNSPFATNGTQSLQANQGNADSALVVTLGGNVAANVAYTGFNGNDTLFIGNNSIVALNGGASSGFGTIDLAGGGVNSQPTLTIAQHNAVVNFANALDAGDRLNISDVATLTGRANVAGYGVAGGSTFTLGAAGQNWTESSNAGQVSVLNLGGLVTTGALNGSGNDTLLVAASATLSGVAPGFANVDFANTNGVVFTIGQVQHEGIGNILNAANTQTYSISGAGAITARVGIETYDTTAVANNTANQVTVNAGATGVNITSNDAAADTIIVGGLTVTGTYNTNATDTVQATNGANIAGVNGGAAITGILNLTGGITMTAAQHGFATITAAGASDSITFTNAFTGTAVAAVETYNLANATNVFTFNATPANAQSVVGNVGADTINATLGAGTTAAAVYTASLGTDAVADRVNITNTALTTLANGGYVNVNNFTVANDQVSSLVGAQAHNGGFQTISAANANLTVGINSVIEVNSSVAQYAGTPSNVGGFTGAITTLIANSVGNAVDGNYTIALYSGNNAALFQFTNNSAGGDVGAANVTQLELVGVFNNVGADAFTGANFV